MTGAHTPSVADVLDAAADLLTPEGAWTQGCFARGPDARMIFTMSPDAVCWCLRGALVRVGAVAIHDGESPATRALGFSTAKKMVDWNDRKTRTQAQVLAKLREAANAARATSKEVQGNG